MYHENKVFHFYKWKTKGRIFASRGIRQGDPLSPFLFLLISEVLGALLVKAHNSGIYEGFVVGKDRIHVPILQYADDTLLFCKFDDSMLVKLRQIVEFFEWCSGQKINWDKSALYVVHIEENKLLSTVTRLNCKAGYLPFIYLGLPLGGYPKKVSFWLPMIDKSTQRLTNGKDSTSLEEEGPHFASQFFQTSPNLHVGKNFEKLNTR